MTEIRGQRSEGKKHGEKTDHMATDREIIISFIEAHYEEFQKHLETEFNVEGCEAELILEELKEMERQ